MIVWYLIFSINNGAVAIPQKDHQQCIDNRKEVYSQPYLGHAYCLPGGPGNPPVISTGKGDDDD